MAKASGPAGKPARGVFERSAGSGVWWIRWSAANGKRITRKIGPYKAACQAVEDERSKVRLKRVCPQLVVAENRKRLGDAMNEVVGASINATVHIEEQYADYFGRLWGSYRLQDLSPLEIERWVKARLKEVKPSTIKRQLAFLSKVYNVAVRERWCLSNPIGLIRVKGLRVSNLVIRWLNDDEIRAMKQAFDYDVWRMVKLALLTGLRQSEQFGLERRHIDLAGRRIVLHLDNTKAGETQIVHLNDDSIELLEEWMTDWPHDRWLVPGANRGTGDVSACPRKFYKNKYRPVVREVLGLHDVNWHTLRHTYATRLLAENTEPVTLMKLMRHKSFDTTLRYAHLFPKAHLEAIDKLRLPC